MSSKPFEPTDLSTRVQAVQDHKTLFSVEAGAGTGKTTLLTSRYVELIQSKRARIDEVVAITFTEKAALELKERIRGELKKRSMEDVAEELDRAPISTIHSFAASLLRERPLEANLDPHFELFDEIDADLFISTAFKNWLTEKLSSNKAPLIRALASGIKFDRIRSIVASLYRQRDLLPYLTMKVEPIDSTQFFDELGHEIVSLWALAESTCTNPADEGFQAIRNAYQLHHQLRETSPEFKERAILLRMEAPSKGNQKNWSSKDACRKQKERMLALGRQLNAFKGRLRDSIFIGLLEWLVDFVRHVEQEKRRSSKIDFDDLILLSRNLLRDHPDVRKYFQDRYKFILVDEFQDTDPIQAELICSLASNGTDLLPGKLFLVGDPKQSIYRFRRADIDSYYVTTKRVLDARGKNLVIHQNFRSSVPLIHWINATFKNVLGDTYQSLTAHPHHEFVTGQKPVWVLKPPALAGEENARDLRRLEAESIAALLRDMVDDQKDRIFDRRESSFRPVRFGDIAILFPTTTEIDLFEEQLRRYELPFALEGGRMFFGRSEVHAMICALEAIERPTNSIAVVAALRSSLFGFSDQDLVDILAAGQTFDYRTHAASKLSEHVARAYGILTQLHEARQVLNPSVVLAKLFELSAAIPLTLNRFHGEQAASNLEKLLNLVRGLEQKGLKSLDQVVQYLQERSVGEEQQDESPLSDHSDNRIRLMTVHKSKGLEFPVVVLANVSSTRDVGDPVIADRLNHKLALGIGPQDERFSTPDFETLAESEKLQRREERKRLLYVAATRAQDLLILTKFHAQEKDPELWTHLAHGLGHTDYIHEVDPASLVFRPQHVSKENVSTTTVSTERALDLEQKALLQSLDTRLASRKIGLSLRTATALKPDITERERRTAQTHPSTSNAQSLGVALHALLEEIDFGDSNQHEHLVNQIIVEDGNPKLKDELQPLLKNILEGPLPARFQAARRVFRELPFSWKEREVIFEGVIDLVLEDDDGLTIVDYKTDRVTEETLQERAEHYRPQLELYARALEHVSQKKITETILYFVRLNRMYSFQNPNKSA